MFILWYTFNVHKIQYTSLQSTVLAAPVAFTPKYRNIKLQ